MKLEMGESLILSWLRHTKHCQSVQLNRKPATGSWELHNKETLVKLMNAVAEHYQYKYGLTLFKNNQSYSQLLQQGEIDVLSLEIQNGSVANIYGIDIAFDKAGLNYGSTQVTTERIMKKLVRTAMIIIGYFNTKKGQVIFASPKIHQTTFNSLYACIYELNDITKKLNLDFTFKLYGNEAFKQDIFLPVVNLSKSVADTSELFMRSTQMYQMFMKNNETEEPRRLVRTRNTIHVGKNQRQLHNRVQPTIL